MENGTNRHPKYNKMKSKRLKEIGLVKLQKSECFF